MPLPWTDEEVEALKTTPNGRALLEEMKGLLSMRESLVSMAEKKESGELDEIPYSRKELFNPKKQKPSK